MSFSKFNLLANIGTLATVHNLTAGTKLIPIFTI